MVLEDTVQRSGEKLLKRIRQQAEQEVRGFVSELLTAAARERAAAIEGNRRLAEEEREQAVRAEGARVRAEVEKTWAAKLKEASDSERERHGAALRAAGEETVRKLDDKVANVRAEGQRVLEAALEAARQEADRTLAVRVDQVRAEAERTIAAELAAVEAAALESLDAAEILNRVLAGVRRLDQASSLSDALDTLAELAGDEASRAGVLTVRGDRVRGWRFTGLGPAFVAARQIDLVFGQAGIVGHAAVAAEPCSVVAGPDGLPDTADQAFAKLPAGSHALAVPVMVGGEVTAIVYGDDAEHPPAPGWIEAIDILSRFAGHCLEALTAARAAQLALSAPGPVPSLVGGGTDSRDGADRPDAGSPADATNLGDDQVDDGNGRPVSGVW